MKLDGKIALVTGASKGIGAGIAKGLAAAGATVVVNYATSKPDADAVVAHIQAQGGNAISVQADMSVGADVTRLFDTVRETYGTLDILVNNAGVAVFQMLEDLTEDAFHTQFNLSGVCQAWENTLYEGPLDARATAQIRVLCARLTAVAQCLLAESTAHDKEEK